MVNAIAPQGAQFAFYGINALREGYDKLNKNPLFNRVTEHWQTALMLTTTALSVISFVAALFAGSTFLTITCFVIAAGSAIGTLCMYHFSDLKSLRQTAAEFGEERQRLSLEVQTLTEENQVFKENNIVFEQTAAGLKETRAAFEKENAGLKDTKNAFEKEAEKLKAQILVLKESAETIRQQLVDTTATNTISEKNAKEIRAQLNAWKNVQDQIGEQFKDQGTEMGKQLVELGAAVKEIFKETAVRERFEMLNTFRTDLDKTKEQLKDIELALVAKQASLQQIHDIYVQMLEAMKTQVNEMGGANTQHKAHNENLGAQVGELTNLIAAIRPFLKAAVA